MTGVEISDHLLWLAVYRSVNILSQLLWAEWKILSEISYLQLLYITSKQQIYVSPRENPIIWYIVNITNSPLLLPNTTPLMQ